MFTVNKKRVTRHQKLLLHNFSELFSCYIEQQLNIDAIL